MSEFQICLWYTSSCLKIGLRYKWQYPFIIQTSKFLYIPNFDEHFELHSEHDFWSLKPNFHQAEFFTRTKFPFVFFF